MKSVVLTPVPVGATTVIGPLVAPAGTVGAIWVPCWFTGNGAAAVFPNLTWVAPVKPVPKIVTGVPSVPLVGEKEVITGPPVTVKSVALVPVPFGFVAVFGPVGPHDGAPLGVVTLILPVIAPLGTKAVIWVTELTAKLVAAVFLNFTSVAPVR